MSKIVNVNTTQPRDYDYQGGSMHSAKRRSDENALGVLHDPVF
jgi:hypothetical protein